MKFIFVLLIVLLLFSCKYKDFESDRKFSEFGDASSSFYEHFDSPDQIYIPTIYTRILQWDKPRIVLIFNYSQETGWYLYYYFFYDLTQKQKKELLVEFIEKYLIKKPWNSSILDKK